MTRARLSQIAAWLEAEPLIAELRQSPRPGCTVLAEGSRCMKMDEVVVALLGRRMRGNQGTIAVRPRRAEVNKNDGA